MENIESTVNAAPAVNVEPQGNNEVVQPTENTSTEQTIPETTANTEEVVTPQQDNKPVQSAEENAKFAEMRRARETAEREAAKYKKDYEIAKKYGSKWNVYSEQDIIENYGKQGIKTVEDFEAAVKRQEYIDQGVDPELLERILNENEDIKWAREQRAKQSEDEAIRKEILSFREVHPDVDIAKLPDEVLDMKLKGATLEEAYARYENKMLKDQLAKFTQGQLTQKTNEENASLTTGSVTGNGAAAPAYFTKEQVQAMSPAEVRKNLDVINESMKKW